MKYTTCYSSSNGQPSNGHATHDTLGAALIAWEANIGALLHRSGGDSTLTAWDDAAFEIEHAEPAGSVSWIEHCEGGYVCADGIWSDEVGDLARYEHENGESLTAAKLVRRLAD